MSRSTVDRRETARMDPDLRRARWSEARVLLIDERGRIPVAKTALRTPGSGVPLSLRPAPDISETVPDEATFLGGAGKTDYWAVPGGPGPDADTVTIEDDRGDLHRGLADAGEVWIDLRGGGALLDDTSAGLATTAEALRHWHRRAQFCCQCGGVTHREQFGWATRCEQCGTEEYPRTDPAVICLVHDDIGVNGERVLLARQPLWPADRYSVLAGFVEAGESLEGCVEREIHEEVGVPVRDIRYLGSQPWPFPRSIMLGFAARADASAPLDPASGEIEEAHWVPRERVRAAYAGENSALRLPGGSSIAFLMLQAWMQS